MYDVVSPARGLLGNEDGLAVRDRRADPCWQSARKEYGPVRPPGSTVELPLIRCDVTNVRSDPYKTRCVSILAQMLLAIEGHTRLPPSPPLVHHGVSVSSSLA